MQNAVILLRYQMLGRDWWTPLKQSLETRGSYTVVEGRKPSRPTIAGTVFTQPNTMSSPSSPSSCSPCSRVWPTSTSSANAPWLTGAPFPPSHRAPLPNNMPQWPCRAHYYCDCLKEEAAPCKHTLFCCTAASQCHWYHARHAHCFAAGDVCA